MRVVSGCYTATLYSGAVNCESTQIQSLMHTKTNVQYNEAASRLVNVWDRPPAYHGLKGRDTIHIQRK